MRRRRAFIIKLFTRPVTTRYPSSEPADYMAVLEEHLTTEQLREIEDLALEPTPQVLEGICEITRDPTEAGVQRVLDRLVERH